MITLPPLLEAAPGNPITSEAWNNLRQGLLLLAETLNRQPGTLTAQLRSKADKSIVGNALVTLLPTGEPADRLPRAAVYLGAAVQLFQVQGLVAGAYDLVVEAADHATEIRAVVMGGDGATQALTLELTPSVVPVLVPNLFGVAVNVAMQQLAAAGLQVSRVIDSYGTDLAPSGIPLEAANSPVLNQVPEPGTVVAKNTPVQLHISAKVAQQVKVPNLAGLTLTEAKQQLVAAGLAVGETKTLGS